MPDFTRGAGSGKTFTMANIIATLNKPTLIIAHNKILEAQLHNEFKEFFSVNFVELFSPSVPEPENEGYLELFCAI